MEVRLLFVLFLNRYCTLPTDKEVILNWESMITLCNADPIHCPQTNVKFTSIEEIASLDRDSIVNVKGKYKNQ